MAGQYNSDPAAGKAAESASQEDADHDDTAADTMEQRTAACAVCHGKHGEGAKQGDAYYPRLADQSKAYLLKQLKDFRAGRRENAAMQHIVQGMSDRYLGELAAYYSQQHPAYRPRHERVTSDGPSRAVLLRGQALATRGKPSANLPACTTCHGSDLMGRGGDSHAGGQMLAPRIVSQYRPYISAQLENFDSGKRHNSPAGVMHGVVKRLSSADRKALSVYLAQTRASQVAQGGKVKHSGGVKQAASDYAHTRGLAPGVGHALVNNPDLVARGRYLARAGDCAACHTADGGHALVGNKPMETPFGTIYTPNITPDKKTGIGKYSPEAFYQAMHNGVSADGRYLYPAFPFTAYTHVTRDDADALYAYLYSLEPVHEKKKQNDLTWPFSMRTSLLGWRTLFFDRQTYEPDPDHSKQWNRGAYLVNGLGHCGSCHTPRNALGARNDERQFTGASLPNGWYAPNITQNESYGIGDWSAEDVARFLKTGKLKGEGHAFGAMSEVVNRSTQYMRMSDLRAIGTYLVSLPAKSSKSKSAPGASEKGVPANQHSKLYDDHCARCHGDNGEGKWPAYPPLKGNPAVASASATNLIRIVSNGGFSPITQAYPRPYSMPPFGANKLSPEEIAKVVTFIRTKWGGRNIQVTPAQVRNNQ